MTIPFPKAFERLDVRILWDLFFIWPPVLLYMLGFILVMVVGIMDKDPTAVTLYVFTPLVPGIGSWLLFAYLVLVSVPHAQAIERRHSLESCGNYALNLFPVGLTFSTLPVRVPAFRRILWYISLTANPIRRHTGHRPTCRLDLGWSPGTHPPLVYE